MESVADHSPLIVILGPTASGKSALALALAQHFGGEIIAADSRTVYEGMDIGTAKPTAAERHLVPHHLLDVVTPNQPFSVADFQRLASQAIADIAAKGKVPFLVGGSGLYIDSVIYNFSFRTAADSARRQLWQTLPVIELQKILQEQGVGLPTNERNPRHLIRALETNGAVAQREPLRPHTLVLGLDPAREILRSNIEARVDHMVAAGLVEEVERLARTYGWDIPALQAPGYKSFRLYLEHRLTLDEAKKLFVQYDMRYAKRQKTWFKRNQDIYWIRNLEEAVELITTYLNK